MNKLQNHFFRLLCEIDEICRCHGISYYLAEHSAWDAVKFGKYHDGMYDTCVMMTVDSLARFEQFLVRDDRRIVDDGIKGTKRYIDPSSTLFDFFDSKRFKMACVGVDIRILVEVGNSYEVVCPSGETKSFPKSLFDSCSYFELDGSLFPLVSDFDAYLGTLVSKNWREKTWPFPIPKEPKTPYNLIYVDDLPFETFSERVAFRKSSNAFNSFKRWLYWLWRKRRYDKVVKTIDPYEKRLTVTEDRFLCWEHYYPRKQHLQVLAEADPHGAELRDELTLFIDTVVKHKKRGMGFSFDEDILQIALPILKEEKGERYVKDYLAKIPQDYRDEDIDCLLRRRGVAHPLLEDVATS